MMNIEISAAAKAQLLQQIDKWQTSYPNVPQSVARHARKVVSRGIHCSLLRSLTEEPSKTPRAVDSLFRRAGAILGLTANQLIAGTDWHPNDLDSNRFDAMIAELRTVVWLSQEGFSDIRLLRSRGQTKADATAQRARTKYAVEVACVSGWRYPGHDQRSHNFPQLLQDKYREKKSQLEATAAEYGCESRVLVCVFVGLAQTAMVTREQYHEEGIKPAWYKLGGRLDTHLAVIAHPSDICVFPPWR
jgi:hypothetical protein